MWYPYFLRLLSETTHSTSSKRQLVHGICSTTLHLTFLDRQDWQALDALLFTLFWALAPFVDKPAASLLRFAAEFDVLEGGGSGKGASCASWFDDVSDILKECLIGACALSAISRVGLSMMRLTTGNSVDDKKWSKRPEKEKEEGLARVGKRIDNMNANRRRHQRRDRPN